MGRELGGELAPGFMFALEKGARRLHRYGDVVVPVASAVDDIEQVALLARCFVLPRTPRGAFEFNVIEYSFSSWTVRTRHCPSCLTPLTR